MPIDFRRHFHRCVCIINCFEVFYERPRDLMARAQTYSNYKSHNTVKFLIGITPQGSISYISHGWGGRTSDKFITENCGLLKRLLPGDQLLADRGFTVADSVGVYGAELVIPSFTKGKKTASKGRSRKGTPNFESPYPRGASDWFASAEVYHSPVNTPYFVGQARCERWPICLT